MKVSFYKLYKYCFAKMYFALSKIYCRYLFYLNDINYLSFTTLGVPLLEISSQGKCNIGSNFVMDNNAKTAILGKNNRCKLVVSKGGHLSIGNKVGMSNTTIVATKSVIIGNNILIGGGTVIVDTDFHSLNSDDWHTEVDWENKKSFSVIIKDNVFIGMSCIILKGVSIGSNVIIAAGSVVSKDIPDNQVWGGNPAQFIKTNRNRR